MKKILLVTVVMLTGVLVSQSCTQQGKQLKDEQIEAKVLSASAKLNVIMLDVGEKDNVKRGDEFTILRGDKHIATVAIEKIDEAFSVAKILTEEKDPMPGDTARRDEQIKDNSTSAVEKVTTKMYDVRDIRTNLQCSVGKLVVFIKSTIKDFSKESNVIKSESDFLTVVGSADLHKQLQKLLADLRKLNGDNGG
ncbi:MAG: hypothetical protein A2W23_04760 [Planctomycetes bacterium RBG_16_43_13]|nr:MAG: hypothetical protein A2W23_04760 [Planctomycetes bacterium RBG_16_43_13]